VKCPISTDMSLVKYPFARDIPVVKCPVSTDISLVKCRFQRICL
jgi:hypothetical protein